jgi:hypothetical protein
LKLATAGEPVAKPEGFDLVTWYDLSPLRPDEYMRTVAYRWQEAMALRNAYQIGVDDATREGAILMQPTEMQA